MLRDRKPGKLRIVVLGYVIRGPLAGYAWHHLQFVLGLHLLGHEVYFIEDSDDYARCYDPSRHVTDTNADYGLRFAADAFAGIGMSECWTYHDAHTGRWLGPSAGKALEICSSADLLLNLSGANPLRPWMEAISVRALIDTDPVFTQVRHLTDAAACADAAEHTDFFTFGQNFGTPACGIPDDGFPWQGTRQPIVLNAWPIKAGPQNGRYTTVMQWDSYASREYDGIRYGMKADSFEPFLSLPEKTASPLELALGSASAPRAQLRERGWLVSDPLEITRAPWVYQQYISNSKAEFSVAKHGYVVSNSGWFSERTACYLASGRPAIVQHTGFAHWLNSDGGLLGFSDPTEALECLESVDRHYHDHCIKAREIAEEHFDSCRVLNELLEAAGNH